MNLLNSLNAIENLNVSCVVAIYLIVLFTFSIFKINNYFSKH